MMAEDYDEMMKNAPPTNPPVSFVTRPSSTDVDETAPAVSASTTIEYDGQISEKLVETKSGWAKSGRGLTGRSADPEQNRLPPGQRLVENWPVLDLGVTPRLTPENWSLLVDGLVEQPLRWKWQDFSNQPMSDLTSDIHCVTTWSRYDNRWRGLPTRSLLEMVRPKAQARFVLCYGFDGYTTNLPLELFAAEDSLLATHWQGEPLTLDHGGPVRVVVPQLYFWKSAKWLQRIEFLDEDQLGYWETRGYHNDANPWREERYS